MLRDAVGTFSLARQRAVPMAHDSMGKVHSVVFVATQTHGTPGSRRGLVQRERLFAVWLSAKAAIFCFIQRHL